MNENLPEETQPSKPGTGRSLIHRVIRNFIKDGLQRATNHLMSWIERMNADENWPPLSTLFFYAWPVIGAPAFVVYLIF